MVFICFYCMEFNFRNIIHVFKTENFMLIPIFTTIAQILCSGLWGFYGFADMDLKLIIPNLLGVLLCGIQIFAYFYYYIKRKGVPPKNEKAESPENEDYKVGVYKIDLQKKNSNFAACFLILGYLSDWSSLRH